MTPEQRKAKIAAAEALLNDVAADEATPAAPVAPAAPAPFARKPLGAPANIVAAQAQVAASVTAAAPVVEAVAPVVAAAITGPGGDTRVSGQPSVAQTMSTLWNIMKGKK